MIKKHVLVTGSRGMLGSVFVSMTSDLFAISEFPQGFDIVNAQKVNKILEEIKPDIIFHSAAYTDVDGCELNPEKAHQVNVEGTNNLISYCNKFGVNLVYISSTGVYGDSKSDSRYIEDDETYPTTTHHITKLKAEKLVKSSLQKYLILRVGWLYGGHIEHKNNFVYKRFLEARNKTVIYSDNRQKGNPTNCHDVVNQVTLLLKNSYYGTFNCVNDAVNVSRYDYVKEIIRLFELNCSVEVADHNMFNRAASVSINESATNKKLTMLGLNIMPCWQDSLARYIDELNIQI